MPTRSGKPVHMCQHNWSFQCFFWPPPCVVGGGLCIFVQLTFLKLLNCVFRRSIVVASVPSDPLYIRHLIHSIAPFFLLMDRSLREHRSFFFTFYLPQHLMYFPNSFQYASHLVCDWPAPIYSVFCLVCSKDFLNFHEITLDLRNERIRQQCVEQTQRLCNVYHLDVILMISSQIISCLWFFWWILFFQGWICGSNLYVSELTDEFLISQFAYNHFVKQAYSY
jgi:hypothetical protein